MTAELQHTELCHSGKSMEFPFFSSPDLQHLTYEIHKYCNISLFNLKYALTRFDLQHKFHF